MEKKYKKNHCYKCQDEGTIKRASFGLINDKIKISCSKHKTKYMIDLININKGCIICKENNIFKRSTYGLLSNMKITHCLEHKTEEMINLVDINRGCIICKDNNIFKLSSFGLLSNMKKTHCSEHKTEEMINLVDINKGCIVCKANNIFKQSAFGLLSNMKKTHCSEHKTGDMINLVNINRGCIICKENNIFKRSSYGLLSNMKKTHCSEHKTDDMIDLVNINRGCIICKENNIFKQSSFGLLSNMKKTHCLEHKTNDMIDLVNINRGCIMCKENNIFKRANFGKLFEKHQHCKPHSLPNEFYNNNPKCEVCKKSKPLYGQEKVDIIPKRCEEHKLETDIDMISRECESCKLDVFIPSSQTKCHRCLNWKIKNVTSRGVKERKVGKCLTLLSNITGLPQPTQDQNIADGCSKRRPDFYYKDFSDTFSLIVEVDEHQHNKYACSIEGEMRRMIILYEEDSGGFPLIFIRFNPDPYYYKNKVISSYIGREDKLKDVIKGLKNRSSLDYPINVIYLFYDNFEEVKIEPLSYKTENGELFIQHKHPLSLQKEHKYKLSE